MFAWQGMRLTQKSSPCLRDISNSTSREWFYIQNFPAFNGVVFWEEFVIWRQRRTGVASLRDSDEPEKINRHSKITI
jgi:hypothetical protein